MSRPLPRKSRNFTPTRNSDGGKIKLDVPEIAENGLVVPINIEVESPMTDADHVKACMSLPMEIRCRVSSATVHACLRQGFRVDAHAACADPEHHLHRGNVERKSPYGERPM
jgi:hypothetical protein